MSLLRRLAVRISATVARYASPGCKEWAEGLAREVEFIPGDWAALRWAIGSVRVLFIYREAPVRSLADLQVVAQRFADSKRKGNSKWALGLICAFLYYGYCGEKFFYATHGLERLGYGLAVLSMTVIGIPELTQWRRRLKVPPDHDVTAVLQFYRAELNRMCDNYESLLGNLAFTLFVLGLMLAYGGGLHTNLILVVYLGLLWVWSMLVFAQKRRIKRRRLERVKALLDERS